MLLENAQAVARGWDTNARVSLYLKSAVDDIGTARLAGALQAMPEVAHTRLITREDALREFQAMSGFGSTILALTLATANLYSSSLKEKVT